MTIKCLAPRLNESNNLEKVPMTATEFWFHQNATVLFINISSSFYTIKHRNHINWNRNTMTTSSKKSCNEHTITNHWRFKMGKKKREKERELVRKAGKTEIFLPWFVNLNQKFTPQRHFLI